LSCLGEANSRINTKADEIPGRFEIQDMGIKINLEKLSSLFHAFEQADTSTTRMYGGVVTGVRNTFF